MTPAPNSATYTPHISGDSLLVTYRRLLLLRTLFHKTTHDIVRILAADSEPLNLEIPDHSISAVLISEGALFGAGRESREIPEKWQKRVLDVLAGRSGPGRDEDDVRALEILLADGALPAVETAHRYALRLRDQDRLDQVLGELLARAPKKADDRSRQAQAGAVALAREFCADRLWAYGEPRWPAVDRGLACTGHAALQVVIQEMRAGSVDGLRDWLERMHSAGDSAPLVLVPFWALLAQDRLPNKIPSPAEFPEDGMRALLQLAHRLDLRGGAWRLPALIERLPAGWGQVAEPFRRFFAPDVPNGLPASAEANDIPVAE